MVDIYLRGGHQRVDEKLGKGEIVMFNCETCHKTCFVHNNFNFSMKFKAHILSIHLHNVVLAME
jgi:hypothetical protein